MRSIIQQIPNYTSPEEGKTLHEYLVTSSYLQPDVKYWSYEFEGIKLNPQIDLLRHKGKSIHVIDWKVSDSNTSDYSKQLYLAGIVAFHKVEKMIKDKVPSTVKTHKKVARSCFSCYTITIIEIHF